MPRLRLAMQTHRRPFFRIGLLLAHQQSERPNGLTYNAEQHQQSHDDESQANRKGEGSIADSTAALKHCVSWP